MPFLTGAILVLGTVVVLGVCICLWYFFNTLPSFVPLILGLILVTWLLGFGVMYSNA